MCKYCEENFPIVNDGDTYVHISYGELFVEDITDFGDCYNCGIGILFCPMCGQKLD